MGVTNIEGHYQEGSAGVSYEILAVFAAFVAARMLT